MSAGDDPGGGGARPDRPRPERVGSRSDAGNPFLRGARGVGLVALIALGASAVGLVLSVLVALGY